MASCDIPFLTDALPAEFLRACSGSGGLVFGLASAAAAGFAFAFINALKRTIEDGLQKSALTLFIGAILLIEFIIFRGLISTASGLILFVTALLLADRMSGFLLRLPRGRKVQLDLAVMAAAPILSLLIVSSEFVWTALVPGKPKPSAVLFLPPTEVSAELKKNVLTRLRYVLLNDGLQFTKHIEVIPTEEMLGNFTEYDNQFGHEFVWNDLLGKLPPYETYRSIKLLARTGIYQQLPASSNNPVAINVRLLQYTPENFEKVHPIAQGDITVRGLQGHYELLALIVAYKITRQLLIWNGADPSHVEERIATAFVDDFRVANSHLTFRLNGISERVREILSGTTNCADLACLDDFANDLNTVLAQMIGQEEYKSNQSAAQQAERLARTEQ